MILCSTGALLRYGEDYRRLGELTKELLFEGYEFMMDAPYYEELDELIKYLVESGLKFPVVHCEKSIGENISKGSPEQLEDAFAKFELNCRLAKEIGAEKLVIHLWDGLTSDSNFQSNLVNYMHLKAIADRFGIDLCVENVVCNTEDPMKHFCELREKYPDIYFVFDTKMAAFHGQLELLYTKEYEWLWKEKHIRHYHVNDYGGGYMDWSNLRSLPIGKGKTDFSVFFEFARKIGYQGTFTVEATATDNEGNVDLKMLNEQYKTILNLLESR